MDITPISIEEIEKRLAGKTIIYVEDNMREFTNVQRFVDYIGLILVHARDNGLSLQAALKANPDAVAILSDIERPGGYAEGLEWATKYVQEPNAKPVILTSSAKRYQQRAEEAGIPFVVKGFSLIENLGTMLVQALEKQESRQQLRRPLVEKRDPLLSDRTGPGVKQ
jgi:CheY-like chemotaxis protein